MISKTQDQDILYCSSGYDETERDERREGEVNNETEKR